MISQQLIITGAGGQGIPFVTRLLTEVAIAKGIPVQTTSGTHGMAAQRGDSVISHFKVGVFSSRLVRPGHADGLISLNPGTIHLHRSFLKPDGWITANTGDDTAGTASVNADALALQLGNPQAVNLIVLGRALSTGRLFCAPDELDDVIRRKLHDTPSLMEEALAALKTGIESGCGAGY